MSDGWRILDKKWGNCVLHNFPIGFIEIHKDLKPPMKVFRTTVSIYSLQQSAITWDYFDFQEKASLKPLLSKLMVSPETYPTESSNSAKKIKLP